MANTTLLDVLKFKGLNGREIVNDVIQSNPAFTGNDVLGNEIPVAQDTISTDHFEALFRISNPDIDPFRIINSGSDMSLGSYEIRRYTLANATRFFWVDRALMHRDPESGAKFLEAQCVNGVEAVISALEKQFFYGGQKGPTNQINSTPSKNGFQGLQTFVDPSMVYNADGTGDALTSAYLVNFDAKNGCTWIFGQDGTLEFSDPVDSDIPDPANTSKQIPVVKTMLEFYPGFAFLSRYSASRICNIDTSTAFQAVKNRAAFTDEMIATSIAKWPYGRPNAILMSRSAGMLLGASRTVQIVTESASTTITGGYTVLPKDHAGIPIAYSDAIVNNERQVSFS
jgi:hypothetical protein